MGIIEKYSDTFYAETGRLLDEFSTILLANESAKSFSRANIDEMFRITHTIKGSFGMMNLSGLLSLAHSLEDIFSILKRDIDVSENAAELFDILFEALDEIRASLNDLTKNGTEQVSFDSLIGRIKAFKDLVGEDKILHITLSAECEMENVRAFLIVSTLRGLCPSLKYRPEAIDSDADAAKKVREDGIYIIYPVSYDGVIQETLKNELYISEITPVKAIPKKNSDNPIGDVKENAVMNGYICVGMDKLERLRNMANELILLQNKLINDNNIDRTGLDVNKIRRASDELQDVIVSMRMTLVSALFKKLKRTVREICRRLNKEIEFVTEGNDIEIDKSIADALSESLIQIVRNAAVHGIESLKERMESEKPLMGKITVNARNSGTYVVVTVKDDGRGISAEKIAAAAKNAGIVRTNDEKLTNDEILRLITLPGVTTSPEADEMSGRGVGLDVVKTSVEKLRGSITFETQVGTGTSFYVRVPQSLAVIDCISVGSGKTVFLLPAFDIYALLRSNSFSVSYSTDGLDYLRYRGYNVPIIDLGREYGCRDGEPDDVRGVFVLIEGEDSAVAVFADALYGPCKAAIKPLPALIDKLGARKRAISGCTVLDDGGIGFILNAEALLTLTKA